MKQMVATLDDVVVQSNTKFGWHCQVCGYKWKAAPGIQLSRPKPGCKQCSDSSKKNKTVTKHPTFAESKHPLLAEWDYEQNADQGHFPDKIRLQSKKQIFWLCTKCPAGQTHSWSATPSQRTGRSKTGCPCCAGRAACRCNSLQALYPDIAAEWDHGMNHTQRPPCCLATSGLVVHPSAWQLATDHPCPHNQGAAGCKAR